MKSAKIISRVLALPVVCAFGALAWLLKEAPVPAPKRGAAGAVKSEPSAAPPSRLDPSSASPRISPPSAAENPDISDVVLSRLQQWKGETDRTRKNALMQELIGLLTPTSASKIVRSLNPELLKTPVGIAALDQWAQVDRKAAAAWMASQPMGTDAEAEAVARGWWRDDRDAFETYCDQLPPGEWKQKVLISASYEAIAGNPSAAIDWAARLNPDDRQAGLLRAATQEWTRQEPAVAIAWLEQVNDPALREHLIGAAAVGYAETDARASAAWLTRSVHSEDTLKLAVRGIVQTWAGREPAATGEWIAQFSPGPVRDTALESLLNSWSNSDRSAADAWANGLPEGLLRTQANDFLAKNRPH